MKMLQIDYGGKHCCMLFFYRNYIHIYVFRLFHVVPRHEFITSYPTTVRIPSFYVVPLRAFITQSL